MTDAGRERTQSGPHHIHDTCHESGHVGVDGEGGEAPLEECRLNESGQVETVGMRESESRGRAVTNIVIVNRLLRPIIIKMDPVSSGGAFSRSIECAWLQSTHPSKFRLLCTVYILLRDICW